MTRLPVGFKKIVQLNLVRNIDNEIIELYPHLNYLNVNCYPLLQNGSGPFCRFSIPKSIQLEGVYALMEGETVKYIGQCKRLSDRFNKGYGHITPINCYLGGQSTNIKINKEILSSIKNGNQIVLMFMETHNSVLVESNLINEIQPSWNSKGILNRKNVKYLSSINSSVNNHLMNIRERNTAPGKYSPLSDYFKELPGYIVTLTFCEIEKILKCKLPESAYRHTAWWSNRGHNHADNWYKQGWEVYEFILGEKVVFKKKNSI